MHDQIFVNLPVSDVQRSRGFFASLGYTFNEQYSGEQALCVELGSNITAMLLHRDYFATFLDKPVYDPGKQAGSIIALKCASREMVDQLVAKAVAAGGSAPMPSKDHGFMYYHAFQDPDGHCWEVLFFPEQA